MSRCSCDCRLLGSPLSSRIRRFFRLLGSGAYTGTSLRTRHSAAFCARAPLSPRDFAIASLSLTLPVCGCVSVAFFSAADVFTHEETHMRRFLRAAASPDRRERPRGLCSRDYCARKSNGFREREMLAKGRVELCVRGSCSCEARVRG